VKTDDARLHDDSESLRKKKEEGGGVLGRKGGGGYGRALEPKKGIKETNTAREAWEQL